MAQQFWVPHPTEVWGVAVEVEGGESYRLLKAFDSATEEDDLTFSPNATERQLIKPILDLSGLQGVDNICGLSEVTEASVLQTVRQRYRDGLIYTNVGRILLSLNPFQFLPVYGEEIVAKYLLSDDPYSLQPHVYQIAADAFKSVSEEGTPQSALITGESGAGKTETTKLLLQFLAVAGGRKVRLGGRQDAVSGADGSDEDNSIERKLLEANPVLEAFANASTTRNPNSSRFGKWVEVIFSDKCVVMGARITSYLLEVPRVVGHATGERNFHVFYQLLEGLKDSLKGLQTDYQLSTEPASFSYLQPFDPRSRINDAEGLEELKHALLTLGFRAKQQNDLFSIVAALLHLGCICFVPDSAGGGEGSSVDISTAHHLNTSASLLGLPQDGLLELFVTRPLKTGSEVIKAVLAPEKAAAARDGFAQLVYSCLFSWLIARVNESLQPPPQPCALETRMVGILDIAGFESFVRNGFEQLCINLSNEKLQNHFNQDIFLKELEDYEAEGLQGLNVSFQDNAQVLDAIEGKGGIFATLDEELFVPKGSELGFVNKLKKNKPAEKQLLFNKIGDPLTFTVCHYAGNVTYNAVGWLAKNQKSLPAEAVALLLSSSNQTLKEAVPYVGPNADSISANKMKSKTTVASEFKRDLQDLLSRIKATNAHYVRCIKPNQQHKPLAVCSREILNQMKLSGVMEAVKIRKSGFPVRLPHADFLWRYSLLAGKRQVAFGGPNEQQAAAAALVDCLRQRFAFSGDCCLVGKTKVFYKDELQFTLEAQRRLVLSTFAVKIQKYVRGHLARRRLSALLDVNRGLHLFVSCFDQTKTNKNSFLYPHPVFHDAQTAKQLKEKAIELHSLIKRFEALSPSSQLPILLAAREALKKMNDEVSVTLKLGALLDERCADVNAWAAALSHAESRCIENDIVDRARSVRIRLEEEQTLLNQLTARLEKVQKDVNTTIPDLDKLIQEGKQMQASAPFAVEGLSEVFKCAEALVKRAEQETENEEHKGRSETTEGMSNRTFSNNKPIQSDVTEGDKMLRESLDRVNELQRIRTCRSMQQDVLRETVESCARIEGHLISAITTFGQRTSEEGNMGKTGKRVAARRRTFSQPSSEYTESDSEEEVSLGNKRVGREVVESSPDEFEYGESGYLNKFLRELVKASSQCDVEALQFLLSRLRDAGVPTGRREVLVAQQQLRRLSDASYLEGELKEGIILLSWGSVSAADISRLSNLIKQATAVTAAAVEAARGTGASARAGVGVRQDILLAAKAALEAAEDFSGGPKTATSIHSVFAIENYPGLAINEQIQRAKGTKAELQLLLQRELLLRFQKEEIRGPLLLLPAALGPEAVKMFRHVQRAMGDVFSIRDDCRKDIISAATACELLRDEVYVQVLKQLRQNNNFNSVIKGFFLLSALCENCPPSSTLLPYVRQVLELHAMEQPQQQPMLLLLHPPAAATAATAKPLTPHELELQQICSKALQALERHTKENNEIEGGDNECDNLVDPAQKKSTFEFQVHLEGGSRHRVVLGLRATADSLRAAVCRSLDLPDTDEWVIAELLPRYLLKISSGGVEGPPAFRPLLEDEVLLPIIQNKSNRQVYLVFRRPFLKTKENITIHPVHSRLTCLQGASSFLHYPLEEAPEVIAEIATGLNCMVALSAKVSWLEGTLRRDSSKQLKSHMKWKHIINWIPRSLQHLLPPHRWVALYTQFAHEFEKEEGEYVKMNSLLSSLKKLKIFGGFFFLCDPVELKASHFHASPSILAALQTALGCCPSSAEPPEDGNPQGGPADAVGRLQQVEEVIGSVIDNSLYEVLLQGGSGVGLGRSWLCPCIQRRKEVIDKSGYLNYVIPNSISSDFNEYEIVGKCWLACSDTRLVIQLTDIQQNRAFNSRQRRHNDGQTIQTRKGGKQGQYIKQKYKQGATKNKQYQGGIANHFNNKIWEAHPDELEGAFALSGSRDVIILFVRNEGGPRLLGFVPQEGSKVVLQQIQKIYPHTAV